MRGKNILIGCTNGEMDLGNFIANDFEASRENAINDCLQLLHTLTDEELDYYVDILQLQNDRERAKNFCGK
ncbi:MAG: hypothetical protein LUH36_02100, partial [Oscillospiraceae bacterium]|nr:hypothetical protein [Oscillospiraceae bacterium]